MSFKQIVRDIKALHIQGAENVAKAAVVAIKHVLHHSKTHTSDALILELQHAKKILIASRPTEPCMRNALYFILRDLNAIEPHALSTTLNERIDQTEQYFNSSRSKIIQLGANRIHDASIIFTHCHSQTVVDILIAAKKQGKKFQVHNTETRPLLQGRITATQLAKAGIPVYHFVDSAARIAMKKADLCLFGTDAITTLKIFNKIGTELFCEVARSYEVPVYFCTNAWKFDPLSLYGIEEPIENRARHEVWQSPPPHVKIINPAFEQVDPLLSTGIISEIGVYTHTVFVEEVLQTYPWMREERP